MKRWTAMLIGILLVCAPIGAWAAEGDPLLSVDDLLSLQDSYDAFLDELEELIIERGLLSPDEAALPSISFRRGCRPSFRRPWCAVPWHRRCARDHRW